MGNNFSSKNKERYEPFIINTENTENNKIIRKLDVDYEYLKTEILKLQDKNDRMEVRLSKIDKLMQNKYQELQSSINNNNEHIVIITKDMESLLNNDKLLLDKLIEKNIVSTIQEDDINAISKE